MDFWVSFIYFPRVLFVNPRGRHTIKQTMPLTRTSWHQLICTNSDYIGLWNRFWIEHRTTPSNCFQPYTLWLLDSHNKTFTEPFTPRSNYLLNSFNEVIPCPLLLTYLVPGQLSSFHNLIVLGTLVSFLPCNIHWRR